MLQHNAHAVMICCNFLFNLQYIFNVSSFVFCFCIVICADCRVMVSRPFFSLLRETLKTKTEIVLIHFNDICYEVKWRRRRIRWKWRRWRRRRWNKMTYLTIRKWTSILMTLTHKHTKLTNINLKLMRLGSACSCSNADVKKMSKKIIVCMCVLIFMRSSENI